MMEHKEHIIASYYSHVENGGYTYEITKIPSGTFEEKDKFAFKIKAKFNHHRHEGPSSEIVIPSKKCLEWLTSQLLTMKMSGELPLSTNYQDYQN